MSPDALLRIRARQQGENQLSSKQVSTNTNGSATHGTGGTREGDRTGLVDKDHLERVRSRLVENEALAHAASTAISRLPYEPWPEDCDRLEVRLNYGRLPILVSAIAECAHVALVERVTGLRELAD